MRPEDDKPTDGDDEPEVPPATFAGRQRAAANKPEEEPPETETESETETEPETAALDLRPGFTEEFDSIERDLDRELADLVPPRAEVEEEPEEPADEPAEEPEEPAEEPDEEPGDEPDDLNEELGDEVEADPDDDAPPAVAEVSAPTVEAETLAVADQEQAKEAALAGLRARAAKQGATAAAAATTAPEAEPADDSPPPPVLPTTVEEGKKTPRAKRLWARFLAASFLIVVSVAAATSISILVYLTDIAKGLADNDQLASLRDQLATVDGGDPQTILIIGSDKRLGPEGAGDPGRSDTTILLRVDPDKDRIALLSIPRDLKVNIPGVGLAKFNEAYAAGGGQDAEGGQAADRARHPTRRQHQLHGVRGRRQRDRRRLRRCRPPLLHPEETGTSAIDIEAGYQLVKGFKALQYVRFRHFDNDLVRSARQQDFLREARQKLPPGTLINDREELLGIFTEYTTSDIGDAIELLKLLKTFAAVQSAPVVEVHFPAELGTEYVTAGDEAIQDAVDQFLATEGTPGSRPAGESPELEEEEPSGEGNDKPDDDKPADDKPEEDKPESNDFVGPEMDDATDQSQASATQLSHVRKKNGDPMLDFPIYYPTRLAPGSIIINDSRAFPIDGPGDDVYYGYKQVVEVPGSTFGNGLTEEYYGISGTDWNDVPILENPSEVRRIDGKDYLLFYDGDRLRTVGWKNSKGSYWVNNTLLQSLEEGQMLSIATSMRELDSK